MKERDDQQCVKQSQRKHIDRTNRYMFNKITSKRLMNAHEHL